MLRKYIPIIQNTWSEMMQYRLNFVMWRVRAVLNLLTVFFLWSAIFQSREGLFGYNREQILTYILLSQLIGAIVFSSRTSEVGQEINDGTLSNFLLAPINYIRYWWARDISDKILNIGFSVFEVAFLILLFRPPIFAQTDILTLLLCGVVIFLSIILFFYISFLLSLSGFWTADVWAPRFLFFVFTDFFAGRFFPLDIFPEKIFNLLRFLPFTYLLFFPLKIYLGDFDYGEIIQGIVIIVVWIGIFYTLVNLIWKKGLRKYEAQGR